MVVFELSSDFHRLINHLLKMKTKILYRLLFFICVSIIAGILYPPLLPVVMAAGLIHLLRFALKAGVRMGFSQTDYESISPIFANRNYRYIFVSVVFIIPSVFFPIFGGLSWSNVGFVVHFVASVCIFVLTWSEALYEKNFFYDRWHFF